jgi:hypothetical protein
MIFNLKINPFIAKYFNFIFLVSFQRENSPQMKDLFELLIYTTT